MAAAEVAFAAALELTALAVAVAVAGAAIRVMVVGAPRSDVNAGADAIPTGLLENALLDAASEVALADAVGAAPRMVVSMEKFVSVAMLERKLEACEGLSVVVSENSVENDVGTTVTITVTGPLLDPFAVLEGAEVKEEDATVPVAEAEAVCETEPRVRVPVAEAVETTED